MHLNEMFILSLHESIMTHAEIFIEQIKKQLKAILKITKENNEYCK